MAKVFRFIKIAVTLVIVYLIGVIGWQFISMQVKHMNVRGNLKEIIYGEIRSDEYEVRDKVAYTLDSLGIVPENNEITVIKPNLNSVKIKFSYTDSVTIPVLKKSFYFLKEVETSAQSR